jgi:hypothetical protein
VGAGGETTTTAVRKAPAEEAEVGNDDQTQ